MCIYMYNKICIFLKFLYFCKFWKILIKNIHIFINIFNLYTYNLVLRFSFLKSIENIFASACFSQFYFIYA